MAEDMWKRRALSLLDGQGCPVYPEDPDYEDWKMRSEYPCWQNGVYMKNVQDYIEYRHVEWERHKQEKLDSMNPLKRFFWKLLIDSY